MDELPRTPEQTAFVAQARREIYAIIQGDDPLLMVVVGPCSIHDLAAGREYAERLRALADELNDRMLVLMRVYFEKPRTTLGWKGLIMDPHLNGTYDIPAGLRLARQFLGEVLDLGMPTATELLAAAEEAASLADIVACERRGRERRQRRLGDRDGPPRALARRRRGRG